MQSSASNIFDASEQDFATRVVEASRLSLVLVDFWADWCPPCRALTPALETLAAEYAGRLLLVKVEVDAGENMKLAGRYRLRGFPTVILFRAGEEQTRFSGYKAPQAIRDIIDAQLSGDEPEPVRQPLTP
jgi:putative thioredoxin